jgi:hypothetical protein
MRSGFTRVATTIRLATRRTTALASATAISLALTASTMHGAAAAPSVPIVALPAYQVSLFAKGTTDYSNPDSIIQDGQHVFIDYQNVTAKDGSDNKSSTVVEYNLDGTVVRTFSVRGHSDGMRMNPADHLLWTTSNEDGNPVLHTINTNTGVVTAYQFSGAPHSGGYDDLAFLGGQVYVAASNPTVNAAGVNVFPAIDRITLQGNTVQLTPVLMGDATATDTTTNSSVTLNEVDPDSMTIDPQGNLVLVNQAGNELVTLQNPCTAQQTVSRIPTGTQLDDTVWVTAAQGNLYVVDGKQNATYIIRSNFTPGTIFTEMPSDSGVGGAVGTLDPKTGFITPIAIGFKHPTGMLFVPDTRPATPVVGTAVCAASAQGPVTAELQSSNSGTLAGNAGGSFAYYQISNPTATPFTLTLGDGAFDTTQAHRFGFNVYQNGNQIASATAQGKGSGDAVDNSNATAAVTARASAGPVLIQVFNYGTSTVPFTLTKS